MSVVESLEDGVGQAERALEEAKENGKFLFAIWSVSENGNLNKRIITWNFPMSDLPIAVAELNRFARDQRIPQPPPEPLPVASEKVLFQGMEIDPDNGAVDE